MPRSAPRLTIRACWALIWPTLVPYFCGQPLLERLVVALRRAGVELEGVEDHLDVVLVLEPVERLAQVGQADVAPGADHVGPDIDSHHRLASLVRGDRGPTTPGPDVPVDVPRSAVRPPS